MCTHKRKSGEIAPGVAPTADKMCFVVLSPIQRRLSATYPAPILTMFDTKDVNRCPHAYTGKNFRISVHYKNS